MPPVYPPFLSAVKDSGRTLVEAALQPERAADGTLRYHIDFEAFEAAVTPQTRLFLLCNPHNPVGRVFTHAELERMAEICLRHDILICADEIHCNLVFDDHQHRSIAGLAPEVAARTITLLSPSKAFNLPGLGLGFAVVADQALRDRLRDENFRGGGLVNVMGFAAALAAYREGWDWLAALLPYLQDNRDTLVSYLRQHMPEIATTRPEGTYLAWLDCRSLGLEGGAYNFFLERARVGLSDGLPFGKGGEGFLRLNFGCPRPVLLEALARMRAALAARP
jgi:cystathionine beta-lyase